MDLSPSKPRGYTRRHIMMTAGAGLLAAALPTAAKALPDHRVVHALGDTWVPRAPKRIVTLFQGATDTAVSLGITPVGVVESWTQKPVYPYLRAALTDVALVGLETQPSLEDIVYLAPDLIVASRFRNERIYGLLSRIAPTIALDDVYSFERTLRLMGDALGQNPQAQAVWARWDQKAAGIQQALMTRFGSAWPLTVSVLDFREDHVRAYLPNSFSGRILGRIGFTRTTHQADPTRTLEKITSREAIPFLDAQIIFVLMRSDRPEVRQNFRRWADHPLWQRLDGARNGRVHEVDNVAWSLSGGILGAGRMLDEISRTLALDA